MLELGPNVCTASIILFANYVILFKSDGTRLLPNGTFRNTTSSGRYKTEVVVIGEGRPPGHE